ncbi:hypothetical protein PB01_03935 [Psychrobacillus glaciei]|uniref:Uncharacterized protein n=1 Tax=Psychrobacillus glaciei TaxID=2283160 RepID=A0A5J6SJF9_9BACI|nr:hypothetical protein [Psychrobacillus glaciei]QFF98035.1 hypothetical protein PB01_03935 [Psychrobacillus glaciei]
MQSKELANMLRKTADILVHFEGKNLDEALYEILSLVNKNSRSRTEVVNQKPVERNNSNEDIDWQNIITILKQKNGKEIEEYLNCEKILKPKKALLELAKEMSVASSTRQTKEVIKHSIIKYFERQKMDDIIRIERYEK